MAKVYAVITEYLVSGSEPSCELFEDEQDAREYVLDSIQRDVIETTRYDGHPIWKQEVLDACVKAQDAEGDISNTDYQFAVECYNNAHMQYEQYWIFGRRVNSLCFLDCIPACVCVDVGMQSKESKTYPTDFPIEVYTCTQV